MDGTPSPAIVLYDGDCGFCSENARLGRKYQRAGALEWLDNGSQRAKALLAEHGLSGKEEETLIVLEGKQHYLYSDAAVRRRKACAGRGACMRG